MSKIRTCIICGKPAASNEHVFPAALGGRITSRGIYCGPRNRIFGHLVTRLQQQLALMNAALEVRPDRERESKPYLFIQNGIRYSLRGSDINEELPAPFDPDLVGEDGKYPLQASSFEAAKRWIEENKSEDWDFHLKGSSGVQYHYHTEPYVISLDFGGVDFLQSVGYIALTTFAQYFPAEARQDGLAAFKKMLDTDLKTDPMQWSENMVWWDGRETVSVMGENPFEFGHVIAVGVCKEASRAHAYVSFFSCLNFGVDLGSVDPTSEFGCVTMFIDPTSEKAAGSISVTKDPEFNSSLVSKDVSMEDMIDSGAAAKAMEKLMTKIHLVHATKAAREFEANIPSSLPHNIFQAMPIIMQALQPHGQAVFNLLKRQIEFYIPKVKKRKKTVEYLRSFIAGDSQQHDGLTPVAREVHQNIMMLIASQMHEDYHRGTLSTPKIRDYLYGDTGNELIRRFFMAPSLRIAGFRLEE